MTSKINRGTLTHSSGGRRLLAKRRNGSFWLHVEDGFSVVDMPIPDKLAEELADFLSDGRLSQTTGGTPTTSPSSTVASSSNSPSPSPSTSTHHDIYRDGPLPLPGTMKVARSQCKTCKGSGEAVGLFAGMRVPCPDCFCDAE